MMDVVWKFSSGFVIRVMFSLKFWINTRFCFLVPLNSDMRSSSGEKNNISFRMLFQIMLHKFYFYTFFVLLNWGKYLQKRFTICSSLANLFWRISKNRSQQAASKTSWKFENWRFALFLFGSLNTILSAYGDLRLLPRFFYFFIFRLFVLNIFGWFWDRFFIC